jgi:hypothetical protein
MNDLPYNILHNIYQRLNIFDKYSFLTTHSIIYNELFELNTIYECYYYFQNIRSIKKQMLSVISRLHNNDVISGECELCFKNCLIYKTMRYDTTFINRNDMYICLEFCKYTCHICYANVYTHKFDNIICKHCNVYINNN